MDRAAPGAEPITLSVPRALVTNFAVTGAQGKESVGDPARQWRATAGRSTWRARIRQEADQLGIDATLTASGLPLSRARVYLPDLGWRQVDGRLDAKLHYVHVTGETQTADGTLELGGFVIDVPGLDGPALSITSLAVDVEKLDLIDNSLVLGDVRLEQPRLVFDPAKPTQLPMLPKGIPTSKEPPPADAKPFRWSLASLEIEDASLVPLGKGLAPIVLNLKSDALSSAQQAPAAVELGLAQGDGSIELAGKLLVAPVGFNGKLILDALDLGSPAAPRGSVGGGPTHLRRRRDRRVGGEARRARGRRHATAGRRSPSGGQARDQRTRRQQRREGQRSPGSSRSWT